MYTVRLYEPDITQADIKSVVYALATGKLSGNSQVVTDFERKFANYIGVKYAVAVNSGTSALQTALHAVGVGEGDEVIVPSFTIISCANAVLAVGATPVLVDVDRDTWCIDHEQVEAATTDRTKAVMPVHMMGHPAIGFSKGLRHQLQERGFVGNLLVVEDACQALGSYSLAKCGTMGDTSCFSFYPNKTITTGEGGMVTTDDIDVYNRARGYSSLYFGDTEHFNHRDTGFNFRMNGLSAALGYSQIDRIDEIVAAKRELYNRYRNRLADVDGITWQVEQPWAKSSHWMVALLTRLPQTVVRKKLKEVGIETREFFKPLHQQDCLFGRTVIMDYLIDRSVSEDLYHYGLYLPSTPSMSDSQLDYVCDNLKRVLN